MPALSLTTLSAVVVAAHLAVLALAFSVFLDTSPSDIVVAWVADGKARPGA